MQLAESIGRKLRGGEAIELISDVGGGKTTFVRGLARGLGSHDAVSSPSFTLSNQYAAGERTLYHFDLYRLSEPGIMRDELQEVLQDPQAIVVIEWADIIENVLPDERLTIYIEAAGEKNRAYEFSYPNAMAYLIPANT